MGWIWVCEKGKRVSVRAQAQPPAQLSTRLHRRDTEAAQRKRQRWDATTADLGSGRVIWTESNVVLAWEWYHLADPDCNGATLSQECMQGILRPWAVVLIDLQWYAITWFKCVPTSAACKKNVAYEAHGTANAVEGTKPIEEKLARARLAAAQVHIHPRAAHNRIGLGRDSDTRAEGKGKRAMGNGHAQICGTCTYKCKKYVNGPNANAKGNASRGCKSKRRTRAMMRRTQGKRRRGAGASTGSAARDDAHPGSETAYAARGALRRGRPYASCAGQSRARRRRMRRFHDDVRGGSVRASRGSQCEHASAIPPSRHQRILSDAPPPRLPRRGTPPPHGTRGGGRKDGTRAKEDDAPCTPDIHLRHDVIPLLDRLRVAGVCRYRRGITARRHSALREASRRCSERTRTMPLMPPRHPHIKVSALPIRGACGEVEQPEAREGTVVRPADVPAVGLAASDKLGFGGRKKKEEGIKTHTTPPSYPPTPSPPIQSNSSSPPQKKKTEERTSPGTTTSTKHVAPARPRSILAHPRAGVRIDPGAVGGLGHAEHGEEVSGELGGGGGEEDYKRGKGGGCEPTARGAKKAAVEGGARAKGVASVRVRFRFCPSPLLLPLPPVPPCELGLAFCDGGEELSEVECEGGGGALTYASVSEAEIEAAGIGARNKGNASNTTRGSSRPLMRTRYKRKRGKRREEGGAGRGSLRRVSLPLAVSSWGKSFGRAGEAVEAAWRGARCLESVARARGSEGEGLRGVERGEGCVRVGGGRGRGGGRGVHVGGGVGGGKGRRRAVVVLREALGYGQAHRRPEEDGERDEREGACGDEEEGAWAAEERAAAAVGWGCGAGFGVAEWVSVEEGAGGGVGSPSGSIITAANHLHH
ncbi:hypothetical protein DFH09DRAFT_1414245 [Mycena vulgaris]|nr:hypothetical protein DFH09DRAFT_1414245 [Mycena vulgaris]